MTHTFCEADYVLGQSVRKASRPHVDWLAARHPVHRQSGQPGLRDARGNSRGGIP